MNDEIRQETQEHPVTLSNQELRRRFNIFMDQDKNASVKQQLLPGESQESYDERRWTRLSRFASEVLDCTPLNFPPGSRIPKEYSQAMNHGGGYGLSVQHDGPTSDPVSFSEPTKLLKVKRPDGSSALVLVQLGSNAFFRGDQFLQAHNTLTYEGGNNDWDIGELLAKFTI